MKIVDFRKHLKFIFIKTLSILQQLVAHIEGRTRIDEWRWHVWLGPWKNQETEAEKYGKAGAIISENFCTSKLGLCKYVIVHTKWGLCAIRHGIQISMEAILAWHPARSTEWLDCQPKSCEQWRIRTGPIATQPSHSVDRSRWHAEMASNLDTMDTIPLGYHGYHTTWIPWIPYHLDTMDSIPLGYHGYHTTWIPSTCNWIPYHLDTMDTIPLGYHDGMHTGTIVKTRCYKMLQDVTRCYKMLQVSVIKHNSMVCLVTCDSNTRTSE